MMVVQERLQGLAVRLDAVGPEVLAHEVAHPALQHHTRRRDRSPKRWNMACDYAINPLLIDAGLLIPLGGERGRCFLRGRGHWRP